MFKGLTLIFFLSTAESKIVKCTSQPSPDCSQFECCGTAIPDYTGISSSVDVKTICHDLQSTRFINEEAFGETYTFSCMGDKGAQILSVAAVTSGLASFWFLV